MSKVRFVSFLVALTALVFATSTAFAGDHSHTGAGVTFWTPDEWKTEAEGDNIAVMDPAEEVGLFFMMLEAEAIDTALDELDKQLNAVVEDLEMDDEPKEAKINGLDAIAFKGKGVVEGKAAKVLVMLVMTPKGKVMLILGMADAEKFDGHKEHIDKVLGSIAAAR